jgi:hypothetical protein
VLAVQLRPAANPSVRRTVIQFKVTNAQRRILSAFLKPSVIEQMMASGWTYEDTDAKLVFEVLNDPPSGDVVGSVALDVDMSIIIRVGKGGDTKSALKLLGIN